MIEEKYLAQAIAQNLSMDNPDAWACIRAAAQIYLKEHLYPEKPPQPTRSPSGYAMADQPTLPAVEIVDYPAKSDFARVIDGKRAADIWPIMDEIMSIFATLQPDLYANAMAILKSK